MKAKFSIRYKFLAVTTALLAVCVGTYLWLATKEFKNDKRSLVFDYNKSLVMNTASDFESFFTSLADKMRLTALFYREPEEKRNKLVSDLMSDKQDLVYIAGSNNYTSINQVFYQDQEFLKSYAVENNFWDSELLVERPIPWQKIQVDGEAIWNATIVNGAPLIGFGKSVVEVNSNGVPVNQFAVIGFVKADRILKSFKQGYPNEVYMITADGEILAHPEPEAMSSAVNQHDKLIEIAKSQKVKTKVTDYVDKNERYLAAFSWALNGRVLILSKISEAKAFRAVNRLIFRSLLFASMIVTMAFLAAIFFSRSLTHPLDVLMKGMSRVSEGDLSGKIQVRSRDEIALLASSFNKMIEDLRQSRNELEEINRDLENKVKERTLELELQNRAVKEAQEALLRTTRLAAAGEVAGQAAHEVLNPLTSIISRLNKVKERMTHGRFDEVQLLMDINESWNKDFHEGGFQKLLHSWQTPSAVKTGASLWDEDLENIKTIGQNIISEYKNLATDADFLLNEAERIGRIINSFRMLNTTPSELKEASVNKLCEKSVNIMADLANRDNIKIESKLEANVDMVFLDEDELLQVMTNLLRNSIQSIKAKHGDSGNGKITLLSNINGNNIEIHIIDNGVGIKKENKSRLFEKNFTTKSKAEGTGIGLSISRRLIRAFHGDLTLVASTPESGAHFVVILPLCVQIHRGVA